MAPDESEEMDSYSGDTPVAQPDINPEPVESGQATRESANSAIATNAAHETNPASTDLSARFERNIAVHGIGATGQARLRRARVAVVGAGGLGSAVLPYLVGAGVEYLGIADFDTVTAANLCRQVLYTTAQVGTPKVAAAADYLRARSPELQVADLGRIDAKNARGLLADFDVVLECSDNFATKALVAAACRDLGLPLVWGTAVGVAFQVTVLWEPPPFIPPLLRRAGAADAATSRGAAPDSDLSEESRLAPHEYGTPNASATWPYPATTLTDLYPTWPTMAAQNQAPTVGSSNKPTGQNADGSVSVGQRAAAYDSATQGILGATCEAAGAAMVAETVKLLTGAGDLLCGRVLAADLWAPSWRILTFKLMDT